MSQQLTPQQCIDLIRAGRFPVQKKLGQNFLIDENILDSIVTVAGISPDDCVLEIGPGMGALTGRLLDVAAKVIAVEVDKMLIPILEGTLGSDSFAAADSDIGKFVLINDDILKIDIAELIARENAGRPVKVVANLPYYITTPIVMKLLEMDGLFESITVMVQKEVAARMSEGPGSKDYGALSLSVQYYSSAHIVLDVSKNCFYPRPDVDSAVVRLDVYKPEERPVKCEDPDLMFRIIKAAFGQRRKTLVNSISNASGLNLSKAQITEALSQIGKAPTIRGEVLTLEEFATLSDIISD